MITERLLSQIPVTPAPGNRKRRSVRSVLAVIAYYLMQLIAWFIVTCAICTGLGCFGRLMWGFVRLGWTAGRHF